MGAAHIFQLGIYLTQNIFNLSSRLCEKIFSAKVSCQIKYFCEFGLEKLGQDSFLKLCLTKLKKIVR